jgi:hypothetical protein
VSAAPAETLRVRQREAVDSDEHQALDDRFDAFGPNQGLYLRHAGSERH